MRRVSPNEFFTLAVGKRGGRDFVFLQERAEFRIAQVAREEHFTDNPRSVLKRFYKYVFTVYINLSPGLSLRRMCVISFWSHGARYRTRTYNIHNVNVTLYQLS